MSPQIPILLISSPKKCRFLGRRRDFQKNIGLVEDSMTVAQNSVTGVENNYLKHRRFLCKMSPDEKVGISEYTTEKAYPILSNLRLIFVQ
jgi:hypothetical protein